MLIYRASVRAVMENTQRTPKAGFMGSPTAQVLGLVTGFAAVKNIYIIMRINKEMLIMKMEIILIVLFLVQIS